MPASLYSSDSPQFQPLNSMSKGCERQGESSGPRDIPLRASSTSDEFNFSSSSLVTGSSSSTDFTKSPQTVMEFSSNSSIRKGVRFQNGGFATDFIPNDLIPASQMPDKERNKIWWQEGDYYMFKRTSKMIASEMKRRQSLQHMTTSYSSIMERTYSVCCQTAEESNDACPLTEKDRQNLERWRETRVSRRGLERWSFPDLAKERLRRKDIAIRGVIEVQDRFVKGMNLDGEIGAEFIRKSSEQLTRSARLFARALGEADAIAAEQTRFEDSLHIDTSDEG